MSRASILSVKTIKQIRFCFVIMLNVLLNETECSSSALENSSDGNVSEQQFGNGSSKYDMFDLQLSTGKPLAQQANRLAFLDQILLQYDKRAWPSYETGKPTEITVNVYVNSIGPVNAANMEFGMDIYLRQYWLDPRLSYQKYNVKSPVTLNGQDFLEHIWKPDLFFRNLKSANFHMVTVPNKLIRLEPDGHILLSMRLTLKLACQMSFAQYPLDTQRCWLIIGSYAHNTDQVVIKWRKKDAIMRENDIEVPEFDMEFQKPGQFIRTLDTGNFSFLNVSILLVRQNGYHLVQTYLPTFLIVMVSWVSFWLNTDATPARVTLGVTTLLTLTTVASGVRTQLPPVSYVKAIDVWIGACSVMVFGALLEFTLVNYLSRSNLNIFECKPPKRPINLCGIYTVAPITEENANADKGNSEIKSDVVPASPSKTVKPENVKKALAVDRTCRVLFPVAFFLFNFLYWIYYLHFP